MAITYNGNLPDIGSLQQGDTVLFGDKLNKDNSSIQELIGAGSATPYVNGGQLTGINVVKPYQSPTSQYTYQPGSTGFGQYIPGQGSPGGNFTENPDYTPPNPYTDLYNQQEFTNQSPTGYEQYGQQYQDLLASQQAALESQYQENIGNINTQYGQQIQQTKDVGGRNAGSLARILGKAGGFTTTAGGMAIVSQENALQENVNKLESAKQQALAAALTAKNTGNATAMQNASENLYKVQQDIDRVNQQRASNLLTLLNNMDSWDTQQKNYEADQADAQAQSEQNAIKAEQDALKAEYDQAQDKKAFEKDMLGKGYTYVKTPAERDKLKAEGYDIVEIGGRTYAKQQKLTARKEGSKTVWYDDQGNAVKTTGGSSGGGGVIETSGTIKDAETEMTSAITNNVGSDGFLSPQDHQELRNQWIKLGFSATVFDTKFKGYINPNNPNYVTKKQ